MVVMKTATHWIQNMNGMEDKYNEKNRENDLAKDRPPPYTHVSAVGEF